MIQLCFAYFAKSLQSALQPPNDDKDVVEILLGWITEKDSVVDKKGNPVNIGSSLISDLMNRKVDVPKAIKNACTSAGILSEAIAHFDSVIIPCLNPYVADDMYENLLNCVETDVEISKKKKDSFKKLYLEENNAVFLANYLLYTINRTNRLTDVPLGTDDIPLLAEAGYECPICHAPLVEYIKTTAVKRYRITSIYPDDISGHETEFSGIAPPKKFNNQSNQIALCRDHAEEYMLGPTKADYLQLRGIKDSLVSAYALRSDINEMALEDEIQVVISGLVCDIDEKALVELPMEALRIDHKILPENHLLRSDETTRVLRYYNFINNIFSDMERDGTGDFDLIASEINTAYKKLENGKLSQEEIVNQLAEWIRNKSQVGNQYMRACHIVVAYFIQNCEVFHEIS